MLTGLNKISQDFLGRSTAATRRILVCAGTGCLVNGSLKVYEGFVQALKNSGLNAIVELKKEEEGVFVSRTGCQGFSHSYRMPVTG
jgi:NADH-quinone oxidoreductase subunit F